MFVVPSNQFLPSFNSLAGSIELFRIQSFSRKKIYIYIYIYMCIYIEYTWGNGMDLIALIDKKLI